MAIAIGSNSNTSWANGPTVTITAPTGIAVSDVLFAQIAQTATNGNLTTITPPVGWTTIIVNDATGQALNSRCGTYYKVADAGDVVAANFAFSSNGNVGNAGGMIRITGANATAPYATASSGPTGGGTITVPTITPAQASSLLLMMNVIPNGTITTSGYTITTSNPSWTELWDVTDGTSSFALAWAIRTQTTATGVGSMTLSGTAGSRDTEQILAFAPGTFVTVSDTSAVTDTTVLSISIPVSDTSVVSDTLANLIARAWNNISKSISSWINQNKDI